MNIFRLALIILALGIVTGADAQKRKTTKKKSKTTKVVKKQEPVLAVPLDSLVGKAYAGKVGRTVVDFFGNRNTYGDVVQELYLWRDSIYALRQINGSEENYLFGKFSYDGKMLKIGEYQYAPQKDGSALKLQKMQQNKEVREGSLPSVSPTNIVNTLFLRGKYLDRPTIQDEAEKQNALTCLTIAAEYGLPEAKEYLLSYYQKKAERGDVEAIRYLYNDALGKKDYPSAVSLLDKLIAISPDNPGIQCDKGSLLLAQGKNSDAKKLWKKFRKAHASYANTASHPFCVKMRGK